MVFGSVAVGFGSVELAAGRCVEMNWSMALGVECDGSGCYVSVLFDGYDDHQVMIMMMIMRPKGFVDSNVVFADGNVVFADGNVSYVTVLIGMAGLAAIMMIMLVLKMTM